MTPEEKNLISGLFDRLAPASNQAKDPEAEQLIRSKVAENPGAPYLLAQSTLVMQQALANAQNRISDLERQVASAQTQPAQKPGGFLSGVAGLFGGGQPSTPPPVPVQRPQSQPPAIPVPQQYTQPYQQPPGYPPPQQPSGGGAGGFLSGALTTAAGVAGGALLFRGIEGLLGHNPGPFGGAAMPGGGFLNSGAPTENTEIVNNYYNDDGRRTSDDQQVDQGTDQYDPDPDPDPVDYAADDSDPDPDLADDNSGSDNDSDDNSLV